MVVRRNVSVTLLLYFNYVSIRLGTPRKTPLRSTPSLAARFPTLGDTWDLAVVKATIQGAANDLDILLWIFC
jgi:hypothetical protein